MAGRSVLDTLDLCTSLRSQSDCSPSASQGIGWLSPRISFSAGVVDKSSAERIGSSGKDGLTSGDDRALDFEFCMGPSSLDPVSGGCMLSADELFHKGRLLPQSLPSPHPQQDTVSVSFSGPLDTMKTPFVNVDWSPQRPSASKSGPLGREESGFPGPETKHSRYSGPLDMRHVPPSRYSGPLSFADATSSCGVSVEGAGKPKSQTWEKVIGLLRRARSDSHRDRLYPARDQTVPSRKQSSGPMPPKNSGSAASSLRLIFRRNSSAEKSGKAIPSENCSSSHSKSSVAKLSSSEPCAVSSPLFPSAPVQVASSKPAGLAALHVASPIYPTSSASETGRDVESDLWSSSATEVDLRPATERESWRMLETESSLEVTFDRFDKPPAGEIKKKVLDRSAVTTPTATNPSRIVLKNLERCSNPASKVGKGQEQLRALRTREIRRSPERLASYTSNVRVTPDENEKSLLEAARLGNVDQIAELVKQGVRISCKDDSGYSALHWASLYGHIDVVRALLGAGAGDGKRINRKTNSGNTPLHFACTGQHAEVAALLQLYKPDVYALNEYGQTPVSLGLRKLVGRIEEEKRLSQINAVRNQSHLTSLVHESDFERQVNVGEHGNRPIAEVRQKWEAYQSAWSSFLQTYGNKDSVTSSSNGDGGDGEIDFQDIPWPLMKKRGIEDGEDLLLSLLHPSGDDLRSLIQQERLRWHPDKFIQTFGIRLSKLDRDAILLGVKTVSQLLNSLASEQRTESTTAS